MSKIITFIATLSLTLMGTTFAHAQVNPDDYRHTVVEGKDHIGMPASQGVTTLDHHGFRFGCVPSHFSYDDPVVYPGEAGRAHLHMFFGNTDVDYLSTSDSIINSGDSTCQGGIVNRSAYWTPALFNEDDEVVLPDGIINYYKSWVSDRSQIQPIPAGLQILANDQVQGSDGLTVARPGHPEDTWGSHIRVGDHDGLTVSIMFPDCVAVDSNGDPVLTSPGGTSHVAYSEGNCPASHPYMIPQLTQNLNWTDVPYESDWYFASDPSPAEQGTTLHADYVAGWIDEAAEIMAECTRIGARECGPPYPDGAVAEFDTPEGDPFYREWNQLVDPSEKTPSALAGWPQNLTGHTGHHDNTDDSEEEEEESEEHEDDDTTHEEEESEDEPDENPTDEEENSDEGNENENDESTSDKDEEENDNDNESSSDGSFTGGDVVVTADNVNLRNAPNGDVLRVLAVGTVATIPDWFEPYEKDGYTWVKLTFDDGSWGYVAAAYLAHSDADTTSDSEVKKDTDETVKDVLNKDVEDKKEVMTEKEEKEQLISLLQELIRLMLLLKELRGF